MDLIVAIDGSGSISAKGFKILKTFAKSLITRLRGVAYGNEAVKVGVVHFGNGKLDDATKVVSDAIIVSPLTTELEEVKGKIDAMEWTKGFTNMAQGFMKASEMITRSPRKTASGTMLMITDGKPSFIYQTDKAVKTLKGRAKIVIVQVKQYAPVDTIKLMKRYASQPWQTNYVLIPGKGQLKADYGKYADMTLVEMCPRAESPRAVWAVAKMNGYEKMYEGWNCEEPVASIVTDDAHGCSTSIMEYDGAKTFAFGHDKAGIGSCLIYDKKCEGDKLVGNSTYDTFFPLE